MYIYFNVIASNENFSMIYLFIVIIITCIISLLLRRKQSINCEHTKISTMTII